MEDMKLYKFENEVIASFFLNNDIVFFVDNKKERTYSVTEISRDNKKITGIIFGRKTDRETKYNSIKEMVFSTIKSMRVDDYLYTDIRLDIEDEVFLSQTLNFKIKNMNIKTKEALITYHYFKIRDLIDRQGFEDFYIQYKLAGKNETLGQMRKHAKNSYDDYFDIANLKNIINIYSKEVDNSVDYKNPSFKNDMLFKYLDNYYSKYAIIEYDEEKIKLFISKYYITDVQSEDQVTTFIDNFLYLYEMITGLKFSYENKYRFAVDNFYIFNTRKPQNIKFKNFHFYFDKAMEEEVNYQRLMFGLELLEQGKYKSVKKKLLIIYLFLNYC